MALGALLAAGDLGLLHLHRGQGGPLTCYEYDKSGLYGLFKHLELRILAGVWLLNRVDILFIIPEGGCDHIS